MRSILPTNLTHDRYYATKVNLYTSNYGHCEIANVLFTPAMLIFNSFPSISMHYYATKLCTKVTIKVILAQNVDWYFESNLSVAQQLKERKRVFNLCKSVASIFLQTARLFRSMCMHVSVYRVTFRILLKGEQTHSSKLQRRGRGANTNSRGEQPHIKYRES